MSPRSRGLFIAKKRASYLSHLSASYIYQTVVKDFSTDRLSKLMVKAGKQFLFKEKHHELKDC